MTLLLLHIVFAFSSIIIAAVNYIAPTQKAFYTSYGLIVATLGSGVALISGAPDHALQATISGVIYLSIVTIATFAAHQKVSTTEH